jgi:sugar-phosphatase
MTTEIAVDGVLFDNDGVLVRSHAQTELAWATLADEFGIPFDRLLGEGMGVRAADTLGRLVSGDQLDAAVARLEELEVGLGPQTEPMPGAVELASTLPIDRWVVVTSAARPLAEARWRGAGLPFPKRSITADDVTRGKPDPEPFLAGARLLGVDPERCVVFEDSPAGGQAARAAGAQVVAVGEQTWPDEVRPVARVADLTGVRVGAEGAPGPDGGLVLLVS